MGLPDDDVAVALDGGVELDRTGQRLDEPVVDRRRGPRRAHAGDPREDEGAATLHLTEDELIHHIGPHGDLGAPDYGHPGVRRRREELALRASDFGERALEKAAVRDEREEDAAVETAELAPGLVVEPRPGTERADNRLGPRVGVGIGHLGHERHRAEGGAADELDEPFFVERVPSAFFGERPTLPHIEGLPAAVRQVHAGAQHRAHRG